MNCLLLLASLLLGTTLACTIQNTNSGVCTSKYLPSTYASNDGDIGLDAINKAKTQWEKEMPFCGRWITSYYSPCVPSRPTNEWAPADKNFQLGRLTTDEKADITSVRTKDDWVENYVSQFVETRIERERADGNRHFYKNKDCQEAFARFTCW